MATDTLSLLRSGQLAGATHFSLNQGLAEFPREIFDLAETLEVLDLSRNRLSELPEDFHRLTRLRILFCSENPFRRLPEVLHACPNLTMVGFKSCELEVVDAGALPRALRWLILTDNRIKELPSSIGNCGQLQKLMLSGNRLECLPEAMAGCGNLELLRLASNQLQALPDWLLTLPHLAWLGIAGNPMTSGPSAHAAAIAEMDWATLELQSRIGEGASGIIHRARLQQERGTRPVAVKLFKGAMTSDGLPAHEMAACLAAGGHPNLVGALGRIVNHPVGATGLVMPLVGKEFITLARPPSLDSCTRDVYPETLPLDVPTVMRIALGIARAGEHLHSRHLLHGDLYAHNILWNSKGDSLLGDFGAASFYPGTNQGLAAALQRIEVRAYGLLLEELLLRCQPCSAQRSVNEAVWRLKNVCASPTPNPRPTFTAIIAIIAELRALMS